MFEKRVKNYSEGAIYLKSAGEDICSDAFPVGEVEKGNLTFEDISERIVTKSCSCPIENIFYH